MQQEEILENKIDKYLCYVNKVGQDLDKLYHYQFLFSTKEQLDIVWGNDWNFKPSGICQNLEPDETTYDFVYTLQTTLKLDVAQENMCFSMQDCINHVIALAWENIDDPDAEYPEEGVIVFQFGESIYDVQAKLAKRGIIQGWQESEKVILVEEDENDNNEEEEPEEDFFQDLINS